MSFINNLTHRKARSAQVGVTYFFLAGCFGLIAMQEMGYFKAGSADIIPQIIPLMMLVLSFWFQRQRTSVDDPPAPPRVVQPPLPQPPRQSVPGAPTTTTQPPTISGVSLK